jgi:uroporphyrinogen-III decarboxylase
MAVIMHSCGKITDIIDDLIETGVNCLQFDQPRLHGIDTLADRFAGKVTFWCPVDIQKTLQTQDPRLIRAEVKELIEKLGRNGGGFIAGNYVSDEALGIPPSVQDIARKAFVEFGNYR